MASEMRISRLRQSRTVRLVSVSMAFMLGLQAIAPAFYPGAASDRNLPVIPNPAINLDISLHPKPTTAVPPRLLFGNENTLLDTSGRMIEQASVADYEKWIGKAKANGHSKERALAYIYAAEYEISQYHRPDMALENLEWAIKLLPPRSLNRGLAKYDLSLAYFFMGRYREAANNLKSLLMSKEIGVDRRLTSMFLSHSEACASYHELRAKAGITEPGRIDPICGGAALAVSFRALGKPYDAVSIKKLVERSGYGSDFQDLVEACRRTNIDAHVFELKPSALITYFSITDAVPIVAHVEKDHFVALTGANNAGVSYICSDCGEWPGGIRRLTWEQWKLMEADAFLIVGSSGKAIRNTISANNSYDGIANYTNPNLFALLRANSATIAANLIYPSFLEGAKLVAPELYANYTTSYQAQFAPCPCACPMNGSGSMRPQRIGSRFFPSPWNGPGGRPGRCGRGPRCGDPVSLATGQEEYMPDADMTVYNAAGPSIVIKRTYHNLSALDTAFGAGWSHDYNFGVRVLNLPVGSTAGAGEYVESNGYKAQFSIPSIPSSGTPTVHCVLTGDDVGRAFYVDYKYAASGNYFRVTFKDRSYFDSVATSADDLLRVASLVDGLGHSIKFVYQTYAPYGSNVPRLKEIQDSSSTTLVEFILDTNGNVQEVRSADGRSVYYVMDAFGGIYETKQVSQIVTTGSSSPPMMAQYGYHEYGSLGYFLDTLTTLSATGTGTETATIDYSTTTGRVNSTTDANGNKDVYTYGGTNGTVVESKDSSGNVVYKYTAGFSSTMSVTAFFDADGNKVADYSYSTKPFPDSVTEYYSSSLSRTWYYEWDSYMNLTKLTEPGGIVTEYTYVYTTNTGSGALYKPMGELVSVRKHNGTNYQKATTFSYNDGTTGPLGVLASITTPIPGQLNGTGTQTTTYSYTSNGNIYQVVSPGRDTSHSHTVTYGYTSDGSYSQSEKLGQPITATDTLGKVTHLRYDARNNVTSSWGPIGASTTTTFAYNNANQLTQTTLPERISGAGHAADVNTYLYVGGPTTKVEAFAPGASTAMRTVNYSYGKEGELLSVTGDTELVSYTYDPIYNVKTLTDGNSHATTYERNTKTQLTKVRYPNENNSTGYDQVQFTSYDWQGQVTGKTDGNGQASTFTYGTSSGDFGRLTSVSYGSGSPYNITIGYDSFARTNSTTDQPGSSTTTYDDLNLVSQSTRTYTGIAAKTLITLTTLMGVVTRWSTQREPGHTLTTIMAE